MRPEMSPMRLFAMVGVMLCAGMGLWLASQKAELPELPKTVADLEAVHAGVTAGADAVRRVVRVNDGQGVTTDPEGRARLRLDDGTTLVVASDTALEVHAGKVLLKSGRVFAEGAPGARTEIELGAATVLLTGSNAALTRSTNAPNTARVYAAAGEISIRAGQKDITVPTGDTAAINGAEVNVAPERAFDDWTSGLAAPWGAAGKPVRSVGELWGRPMSAAAGEVGSPLTIRAFDVDARILGEAAETTVKATFFHSGSELVNGDFRMALPPGALVSSFAVGNGGEPRPASFGLAARGEGNPHPVSALLEWAGEGWVRGTIPGISPGSTVSVQIRYVEWLDPYPTGRNGSMRVQYRFPLVAPGLPPLVSEFSAKVNASEANPLSLSAGLGATVAAGVARVRKSDFRPSADLVVEAELPAFPTPARLYVAHAASGDDGGDFVFARTEAPEVTRSAPGGQEGVSLALVIDTSSSTDPAMLDAARSLAESLTGSLGKRDQLVVFGADEALRPIGPDKLGPVDSGRRKAIFDGLSTMTVGGATDLGHTLEQAADALASSGPSGVLVYVGDGWPSMGDFLPGDIRARLARRASGVPRMAAVVTGPTANRFGLAALTRGTGPIFEITDGASAAAAAAALMADALKPATASVQISLGPDVEQVYPLEPRTVPAGRTVFAVGRARRGLPREVTLHWRDSQGAHDQLLPAARRHLAVESDLARRWAAARVEEIVLHGRGREAAADVAVRSQVMTPWTGWSASLSNKNTYTPTPLDARVLDLSTGSDSVLAASLATRPGAGPAFLGADDEPGSPLKADDAMKEALRSAAMRLMDQTYDSVVACRDARAALRPDLAGVLTVKLQLDGDGHASNIHVTGSRSASDDVLFRCVTAVVEGIAFPPLGVQIKVDVSQDVDLPQGRVNQPGKCSATSQLAVALRRGVWLERLQSTAAPVVYMSAMRSCELPTWTDRGVLLELILQRIPEGVARVEAARSLQGLGATDAAEFLKREALRRAASPDEVRAVRAALLHAESYPREAFEKRYLEAADDDGRLAVVRRFLALAPHSTPLRVQQLRLLESLKRKEAVIHEAAVVRRDPFADATVLAEHGAALHRLGEEGESRRTFGEIIERAPFDPWVRAFTGDRLRGEGWFNEATAVYAPLDYQLPADLAVVMRGALAHEGAGRLDLAARMLTRMTQTSGRSESTSLSDLAADVGSILLIEPRYGVAQTHADDLGRRLLDLPQRTTGTAILVRTDPGAPPIEVRLVRGPTNAREEREPDISATQLGLYRLILDANDATDVVVKLTAKRQLPPVRPIKVRVDGLTAKGTGKVPALTTTVLELPQDGKPQSLKWKNGSWVSG